MNYEKLQILQVGRDINGTGGGRVIIETSRYFKKAGYDVLILTDNPIPLIDDIPVITTPFGEKLKQWQPSTKFGRIIRHFLQIVFFMFFGTIIANGFKNKRVILNHNIEILGGDILVLHNVFRAQAKAGDNKFLKKLIRIFNPVFTIRILREFIMLRNKNVKAIVAVSQATLDEAIPYIRKGIRCVAINNGVNIEDFRVPSLVEKENVRNNKNVNENDFLLLFVGHEFERKGLNYVIKAMTALPPNVKLWVVGGRGSSIDTYKNMTQQYSLNNRVIFFGTQYNTSEYYWAADAFILPSSYETWALVGLEAMACGLPCLMTPVGGIKEYLIDGYNGFFVKQDPEDIAEKVRRLINDKTLHKQMSLNARKTAEKYGWDSVAIQYLKLINEIGYTKLQVRG
jgi:glycosyltransferase involved in cell wall biosynthesis